MAQYTTILFKIMLDECNDKMKRIILLKMIQRIIDDNN